MDVQEKIEKLTQEKEFAEAFEKVETPEEVVKLFADNGVEIPLDIAKELFEPIIESGEELSENELAEVSGGSIVGKKIGSAIGYGTGYCTGYLVGRMSGKSKKLSQKEAKKYAKIGAYIGGIVGDKII